MEAAGWLAGCCLERVSSVVSFPAPLLWRRAACPAAANAKLFTVAGPAVALSEPSAWRAVCYDDVNVEGALPRWAVLLSVHTTRLSEELEGEHCVRAAAARIRMLCVCRASPPPPPPNRVGGLWLCHVPEESCSEELVVLAARVGRALPQQGDLGDSACSVALCQGELLPSPVPFEGDLPKK